MDKVLGRLTACLIALAVTPSPAAGQQIAADFAQIEDCAAAARFAARHSAHPAYRDYAGRLASLRRAYCRPHREARTASRAATRAAPARHGTARPQRAAASRQRATAPATIARAASSSRTQRAVPPSRRTSVPAAAARTAQDARTRPRAAHQLARSAAPRRSSPPLPTRTTASRSNIMVPSYAELTAAAPRLGARSMALAAAPPPATSSVAITPAIAATPLAPVTRPAAQAAADRPAPSPERSSFYLSATEVEGLYRDHYFCFEPAADGSCGAYQSSGQTDANGMRLIQHYGFPIAADLQEELSAGAPFLGAAMVVTGVETVTFEGDTLCRRRNQRILDAHETLYHLQEHDVAAPGTRLEQVDASVLERLRDEDAEAEAEAPAGLICARYRPDPEAPDTRLIEEAWVDGTLRSTAAVALIPRREGSPALRW